MPLCRCLFAIGHLPFCRCSASARPLLLLCQCTAGARPLSGRYQAGTRPVLCCCLASTKAAHPPLCRGMAAALPKHGRYTAGTWPAHGGASLTVPGRFSANARPRLRQCKATTRPLPGQRRLLLPCQCNAATRRGCFAATWLLLCQCTAAAPAAAPPMQGRYPAAMFAATLPVQCRHPARLLCHYLATSLPVHGRCPTNATRQPGHFLAGTLAAALAILDRRVAATLIGT